MKTILTELISFAVRRVKNMLNNSAWSSDEARATGLRRLALAQLGSLDAIDDTEFTSRVARLVITKYLPIALRVAAQETPQHYDALMAAALKCETEGTKEAAIKAREVAVISAVNTAAYYAAADGIAASAVDYVAYYVAAGSPEIKDNIFSDFAEDIVQILIELKSPGCEWLYLAETL